MHPRLRFCRWLMSAILVVSTVASFALDWRENHLLNPEWHPHARFHGGLLLFFLAGVSAVGLWVLWRKSPEPAAGVRIVGWLAVAYWTPLFYAQALVPGSSLWAGIPGHEPRLGGYIVYPNLVVAGVFIALTLLALGMTIDFGTRRSEGIATADRQ